MKICFFTFLNDPGGFLPTVVGAYLHLDALQHLVIGEEIGDLLQYEGI